MVNGLFIAQNALQVNQAALSVTGQNLTNMNTEGYSRQRVDLSAMTANIGDSNNLVLKARNGMGCNIESITRYRDAYLDSVYRDNNTKLGYYNELASAGLTIENFANEFSSSGLLQYFDDFYTAAQNMSLYPNDLSMKLNFTQTAVSVCNALNSMSESMANQRKSYVGSVDDIESINNSTAANYVNEINDLIVKIADLNKKIVNESHISSSPSSGLLDERDLLIDKLSSYVPVTVTNTDNAGVSVSLGNVYLVKSTEVAAQLKVNVGDEDNPCRISIESPRGGTVAKNIMDLTTSGKLGAVLTIGGHNNEDICISTFMYRLNGLANEFANTLNNLQVREDAGPPPMVSAYSNGSNLIKATSPLFVNSSDGTTSGITAGNISVNESIINSPQAIACAYVEATDDTTWEIVDKEAIGNNKNAQAFYDTRNYKNPVFGSKTFEEYIIDMASDIGTKVERVNTNLEVTKSTFEASNTQRQSVIGVSMEEELTDLVRFQRAYEAAARIFSTSSEILQVLVNLGR